MFKKFDEIKIGQMFTFFIWMQGKKAFTKIDNHHAEDEKGESVYFVANDIVETL